MIVRQFNEMDDVYRLRVPSGEKRYILYVMRYRNLKVDSLQLFLFILNE